MRAMEAAASAAAESAMSSSASSEMEERDSDSESECRSSSCGVSTPVGASPASGGGLVVAATATWSLGSVLSVRRAAAATRERVPGGDADEVPTLAGRREVDLRLVDMT